MPRPSLCTVALWLWIAGTAAALAQNAPVTETGPALLVADQIFITPERQLVAEGNVEAYQGELRLRAQKITYDRESGTLDIEGPIRIDQGGDITILASAAEMDSELQNGLLTGARLVFDQQLQLASLQMTRVGGRYTQLYKSAITSCRICANGETPLWQIRARKVTHDQLERQIYLEGAQLRIRDVPVFYFPYLRLPDPTLERATGFLIPSIRSTSQLGVGFKLPYFIRLGDSADLTLEPYLSPQTRTLGYRYRQVFRRGGLSLEGAHTRDDLIPSEDRGYLFALGNFDLGNDFRLEFDLKGVSDDAYLVDYGLPDYDRLRSSLSLDRINRNAAFASDLIYYKSLRDSESEDQIPTEIFDVAYEKRFFPGAVGGELRLGFWAHGHRRPSSEPVLGRDVGRVTADLEWLRDWSFANGLRADWKLGLSVDRFQNEDDNDFPAESTKSTPRAALTLRYPLLKRTESGATQYLEPIAQIGWANTTGEEVPVDESGSVEFDQGNLLALSRFPAPDAREEGLTAVVGLNWARFDASGWNAFATIGQVFRENADPRFTSSSGLSGQTSDLLLSGQLQTPVNLSLTARGLLNGSLDFSKFELRGDWRHERGTLAATYLWLESDARENRPQDVSEIWFDGSYQINPKWRTSARLRYNVKDSTATRAGLGAVYRNECLTVDLSVSRRNTSTETIEPTTDFGISIALNGFAVAAANKELRRSCERS